MKTTTTTTTCDESTALLRDPSAKTARRSVASRVGLALGLCAAIVLAWATVTTEDADPNAPTVAEPPFWATVDVGDGRELSARAYAAFLKRRLAEDALSEDGLMTRAELGNETLAEDEDAEDEDVEDGDVEDEDAEDEDVEDAELGSRENSPEMQTLLDRIAADEYDVRRLAESELGAFKVTKQNIKDVKDSDQVTTYSGGKNTAGAVTNSGTSFCWKDSYGRGVGTIPRSCPKGKETIAGGLLCYDKCSKFGDFKRFGYDCHQKCKSGWADHGLLCYRFKSTYGRGVGRIPPLRCKRRSCRKIFRKKICVCRSFKSECPSDRSDKCIGLCYKKCRSGYDRAGCNICAMNCKAQGYAKGAAPSCPKRMYLSPGAEGTKCASNKEKDAGLCYKRCRDSFNGVGPVCWGQPPRVDGERWVNCGMGAATDKGTCASTIMDQVTGPVEVAAFVATAGVSGTASKASKIAKIKSQMKTDLAEDKKAYEKIFNAICDVVKSSSKKSGDAVKLTAKEKLSGVLDMLDRTSTLATSIRTFTYCKGVDCFRGVAELMAIVDPTGIAGTAAAYAFPKCDKVPSSSSSSQPKTTPTQELKPYVKTAGRALNGNGASGACSARLYYGSSGIKACEKKCNQCGDCKGFVDNRKASKPYCVFKKATNVYKKASKDWYAKPN